MKLQYLADRLSALQKEALYREVSSFEPVSATHVKQQGRKFLMKEQRTEDGQGRFMKRIE